jgi:hypothetical protein
MKTATMTTTPSRLRSFIVLFKTAMVPDLSKTVAPSSTVKQQSAKGGNNPLRKVYTGNFFAGPHGIFDPRLLP